MSRIQQLILSLVLQVIGFALFCVFVSGKAGIALAIIFTGVNIDRKVSWNRDIQKHIEKEK